MVSNHLIVKGMIFNYFSSMMMRTEPIPIQIEDMTTEISCVNPHSQKYCGVVYETKYLFKYNTPLKDIKAKFLNGEIT